jgi:DNA-binding FadR family transcriptional regulator
MGRPGERTTSRGRARASREEARTDDDGTSGRAGGDRLTAVIEGTLPAHAYGAVLQPVRAGNAFEETIERLLAAIKLGIASPGTRLPAERDLAGRLSVSRVTLREALRELQDNGYVESRRGRYGGTFVRASLPSPGRRTPRRPGQQSGLDLEDSLALREVLEGGAAELAARRGADPGAAKHLSACLSDCAMATDVADYRRLDSRFHLAVAEVAGSPSLTAAVAKVRMKVNGFLDSIPTLTRNIEHSERQHAAIATAIVEGEPEEARQAMAEHLSATAALLRGFLD